MNYKTFTNLDTFSEMKRQVTSYPFSIILLNIRSLRKNFNTFITTIQITNYKYVRMSSDLN